MKRPRPSPEMREGQEAFERFNAAMKAVLAVPKSAMPPSPFKRAGLPKPRKAAARKAK